MFMTARWGLFPPSKPPAEPLLPRYSEDMTLILGATAALTIVLAIYLSSHSGGGDTAPDKGGWIVYLAPFIVVFGTFAMGAYGLGGLLAAICGVGLAVIGGILALLSLIVVDGFAVIALLGAIAGVAMLRAAVRELRRPSGETPVLTPRQRLAGLGVTFGLIAVTMGILSIGN